MILAWGLSLLLALAAPTVSASAFLRKSLALDDPGLGMRSTHHDLIAITMRIRLFVTTDLSSLFNEKSDPPPLSVASAIECAAVFSAALAGSTKASGFKYDDGTCTLGHTLQYNDAILTKPAITGGKDGVYAVMSKPTSKRENQFAKRFF